MLAPPDRRSGTELIDSLSGGVERSVARVSDIGVVRRPLHRLDNLVDAAGARVVRIGTV